MDSEPKSPPSLQQVADAAGVAKSTASLALRNDPRVSPATLRRVQDAARLMGFRNNAMVAELMAKLRGSRSPRFQAPLALVNCSPDGNFLNRFATYRRWVAGVKARAEELGFKIDYFWAEDPTIKPERLRSILNSRNIRGAILARELGRELPQKLQFLWGSYPTAVLGSITEPRLHLASNDQHSTVLYTVRELVRRGYRRFGLMRYADQDYNVEQRFSAGFLAACRELSPKIENYSILELTHQSKSDVLVRDWVLTQRLDAILASHRDTSRWLPQEVKSIRDVAVVHLDWDPSFAPETGMNQNSEIIGTAAVDLVVGQIHRSEKGVPSSPKSVLIQSTWVEGTTAKWITKRGARG